VHVFDRIVGDLKPQLTNDHGATYHTGDLSRIGTIRADIIIECTGATPVIANVVSHDGRSGIVCLAGVSSGGHSLISILET
jgi:threonine dehydrogenase-like Zn-dependent dehydrogenase